MKDTMIFSIKLSRMVGIDGFLLQCYINIYLKVKSKFILTDVQFISQLLRYELENGF